jgi:hypothetical protein
VVTDRVEPSVAGMRVPEVVVVRLSTMACGNKMRSVARRYSPCCAARPAFPSNGKWN